MPTSSQLNATRTYALVTAAYNEEKCIEKVIRSVLAQTLPPQKWIIVSDGSTDRTDEIVQRYAAQHPFIELVRITEDHPRNFNAQVNAINLGFSLLKNTDCEFIANLDADITLDSDYFDRLLDEFATAPRLGLSGGYIYEEEDGTFRCRSANSVSSVAHGVHCFRRECLALLGGYAPFSWGGTDTHAGVRLRMLGWKVESIPTLPAYHHRPTGGGFGAIRYRFRGGLMDHYFGTHPLFEIFRIVRRIGAKPYVIGGLVRMAGFLWGYCKGAKREVSPEFIEFLRKEQMERLRLTFSARLLKTSKIPYGQTAKMQDPETVSVKRTLKCLVSLAVFLLTRAAETLSRVAGKTPNGKCVVLYYHSVPASHRQRFSKQMDTLLRYAEPASLRNCTPVPSGALHVAVTFDDALQNLIDNALPELHSRKIPVTIFVISGALGKTFGAPEHLEQVMTPEELQALPENSITLGSHSVTHPFFPSLAREAARWELEQSRAQLSSLVQKEIVLFSFPFGAYTDDLVDLCRDAGYQRVFTTQPALAFTAPDEFAVGRVRVDPTDWPLEFFLKMSGAYRWLPWAFRLKRRLRSSGFLRTLFLRKKGIPELSAPKAMIQ